VKQSVPTHDPPDSFWSHFWGESLKESPSDDPPPAIAREESADRIRFPLDAQDGSIHRTPAKSSGPGRVSTHVETTRKIFSGGQITESNAALGT
jgi:hypothetical protein